MTTDLLAGPETRSFSRFYTNIARSRYRLAPADGPLTEDVFQKMPLKFVGNSSLRWGGVGGEQLSFNSSAKGWEVTGDSVFPTTSVWRKNPIPHTVNEWFSTYSQSPILDIDLRLYLSIKRRSILYRE